MNYIRQELSALVEIKRNNRKVQDIKSTRLLTKYNTEKKENLDHVIKHRV